MTNGSKSTELWVTLVVLALITLNNALHLGLDTEAIIGLVGASGTYSIGRGIAKMGNETPAPKP